MRKVIKISVSVLSWLLLAAIIMPIAAWLLLFLPPVQRCAATLATDILAQRLGVAVGFDRVRLKLFDTVALDGLYIADNKGDTLAYANFGSGLELAALIRGKVVVRSISLADGQVNLTHIDHIISKLNGGGKEMEIAAVDVRGMEVRWDSLVARDVELHARNLSSAGNSISFKLKRLSLTESGGLTIVDLSCPHVLVAGSSINLDMTHLETTASEFDFERLGFDFATREVALDVRNSTLALADAGRFAARLRKNKTTLNNLSINIDGAIDDLRGNVGFTTGEATRLAAAFSMRGEHGRRFSATVDSLSTIGRDVYEIVAGFTAKPLPDSLSAGLRTMGPLALKGGFEMQDGGCNAKATLVTMFGSGHGEVAFAPDGVLSGSVEVENMDLGRIMGHADVGALSAAATVDGRVSGGRASGTADITVSHLEYRNIGYQNITAHAQSDGRLVTAHVVSRDPRLRFDAGGHVTLSDTPSCELTLNVANADLHGLNINRRDSVSQVSFRARATAQGSVPDDVTGEIVATDILYVNHINSTKIGTARVVATADDDGRRLALTSDIVDATIGSKSGWAHLGRQLNAALSSYTSAAAGGRMAPDGITELNVEVKSVADLVAIAAPGVVVSPGARLTAALDPADGRASLTAKADYIERGRSFVSGLNIEARTQGDSLTFLARAGEVYAMGYLMPRLNIAAYARGGRIGASACFVNVADGHRAHVEAVADITDGRASIRLGPSYYRAGALRWNVSARGITVGGGKVAFDGFEIASAEGAARQELRMDGVASGERSDTLRLAMSNLDLNPLSDVVRTGYEFQGRASGHASLISALSQPVLAAAVDLTGVKVDSVEVPQLRFLSQWERESSRVRLLLLKREESVPLVMANYHPSTRRVNGEIRLEGIDLSLLDTHYSGTLGNTAGLADVNATISGTGRAVKVNGTIDVREYGATVDYLGVRYNAAAGTRLLLRDNVIEGRAVKLADKDGNTAEMDMRVDLGKLNNAVYRFDIKTDRMLVLDTSQQDNDMFYGKVYASGTVAIKGSKQGVDMDIAAATGNGSQFYMPLSGKTDVADADFVTFTRRHDETAVDSSEWNVRRRMIMERAGGRRRINSSGRVDTDIALTVSPNTLVELLIDPQTGHRVRAHGNGLLNLHANPLNDEFSMYGDYRISDGVYLLTLENIIERHFAIEQGGSIQWTGNPLDAMLDISGVYSLKTSIGAAMTGSGYDAWRMRIPIDCRIRLTDRLSEPSLTFNITAPGATPETQSILASYLNTQEMMATQFFFLLATGNFYDYEGSPGMSGNIGAAASNSTAFDFLSNQISNWISSDRFNIGIRYRPQTETTSDEWGVDFSQQLWGERLLLEVEGNYDTRNNAGAAYSENMKNFTGDFSLTGILDKAGSLRARLFTRTITRFDENQGLQENGAGIYYTEDFNTFGDIIRNLKKRFTRKKKTERTNLK